MPGPERRPATSLTGGRIAGRTRWAVLVVVAVVVVASCGGTGTLTRDARSPGGAGGREGSAALEAPGDLRAELRWFGACPDQYVESLCPTALPAGTLFTHQHFDTWSDYERFADGYDAVDHDLSLTQGAEFAWVDGDCDMTKVVSVESGLQPDGICSLSTSFSLNRYDPVDGALNCDVEGRVAPDYVDTSIDGQTVTVALCEFADQEDLGWEFPTPIRAMAAAFQITSPCSGELERYSVRYEVEIRQVYLVTHFVDDNGMNMQTIDGYLDPASVNGPEVSKALMRDMLVRWQIDDDCSSGDGAASEDAEDPRVAQAVAFLQMVNDEGGEAGAVSLDLLGDDFIATLENGRPWQIDTLDCPADSQWCFVLDTDGDKHAIDFEDGRLTYVRYAPA